MDGSAPSVPPALSLLSLQEERRVSKPAVCPQSPRFNLLGEIVHSPYPPLWASLGMHSRRWLGPLGKENPPVGRKTADNESIQAEVLWM